MPRIVITEGALLGLERCRQFLLDAKQLPTVAQHAAQAIAEQFRLLETTPDMGRPLEDLPHLRELVIVFGDSGYVALYRHEPADDAVYLLAFRHQKQAGY